MLWRWKNFSKELKDRRHGLKSPKVASYRYIDLLDPE